MIINISEFVRILKSNFVRIIFISSVISLIIFLLISKSLDKNLSKVTIQASNSSKYDRLLNSIEDTLDGHEVTFVNSRALVDRILKISHNFRSMKILRFNEIKNSIINDLERSNIILQNNKFKITFPDYNNHFFVFEKINYTEEVEKEIIRIFDQNFLDYFNSLDIEEIDKTIQGTIIEIKKVYEEYLINFDLLESIKNKNLDNKENVNNGIFFFKSVCLLSCYNLDIMYPEKKRIYEIYEEEALYKKDIQLEQENIAEKLKKIQFELISIKDTSPKTNYKISSDSFNHIVSKIEIFLFLFLLTFSIVMIFTLFKNKFDE